MSDKPPFKIELSAGTSVRMDVPCRDCHRWTLWRTPVLIVSEHGTSEVGHIETCEICDTAEDELEDE